MPQVKERQFGAFTALVFHSLVFVALIRSCRGQSVVIGASHPITALVGDDIVLPCHLEPAADASPMTVEWARPELNPRFVFLWRDGVELETSKNPSYRGRSSLFTDELKSGNISLKLTTVKLTDQGTYKCFVPGLNGDGNIQLVVGAVSSPVGSIARTNTSTGGAVLQCESEGWYPEPEVLWLDAEGNLLSAGPTETVRGPDDLYTVSSRVTVEKRHSNSFTCRVQQKDINQTRETYFHVSDDFFPGPTSASPSPSSSVPVIVGLVLGFVFILAVVLVFVLWKWRRNKLKKKKIDSESPDPSAEPLMTRDTNGDMDVDIRIRPASEATGLTEETHQRQTTNVQTQGQMEFQDRGRQTNQVPSGGETVHGLDQGQQVTESEPAEEQRETPDPAGRDAARETREDVDMRISPASEATQVSNSESPDPSAEPLMTRDTNGDMDGDIRIRPASEATGLIEETHQRQTTNVQTQGQTEFQDGGRQTNQVPSGGETVHGLDQETESEPAEEQRETPDPAGRDTARETREDVDMRISPASEATQVSNSESPDPSAESLMRRDTNRDTVKNVDTRICPSSEATGLTEETHQRQTNNVQIQERDTQQEQPIEERKTENDLQTEEENDVDPEKDKLQRKLQRKETEIKNFEKNISRVMGLKKEQEKKIKELRLQLEEVERQREETEKKMESVNREEDMMKTQREAAEEEEGEAVKRLLDSRKDLERKKEELQKQLEKTEKLLERQKKEVIYVTEKKIKATKEKEEIIKKIEEIEKQRRRREAAKAEGQSDSDEDL